MLGGESGGPFEPVRLGLSSASTSRSTPLSVRVSVASAMPPDGSRPGTRSGSSGISAASGGLQHQAFAQIDKIMAEALAGTRRAPAAAGRAIAPGRGGLAAAPTERPAAAAP